MREQLINQRLEALSLRPFRARFKLSPKDLEMLKNKGMTKVMNDASEVLRSRLFPAWPAKDGKQTPYRGHPVFVAQHASATCCRSCLERWHKIPKGLELADEEQSYVLEVIKTWIEAHAAVRV
jgi:hypothetical protein